MNQACSSAVDGNVETRQQKIAEGERVSSKSGASFVGSGSVDDQQQPKEGDENGFISFFRFLGCVRRPKT